MRRGFSLVEMLMVTITLPFVFLIFDGLFRSLLSDIPASWRIAQENTTVLSMLEQVHRDIDKAKGLPESFAGNTANDTLLLIELADGVICYQLKDGQVIRRRLTDMGAHEKRVWSLPNAKVVWRVWVRDGKGYAVEAKTHIDHRSRGHWKKKMALSHLYFVGSF